MQPRFATDKLFQSNIAVRTALSHDWRKRPLCTQNHSVMSVMAFRQLVWLSKQNGWIIPRMRFLPIAIGIVLGGSGIFLQKAGDRRFERKGDAASLAGRIAMVIGFLCLLLGLVVLWADDFRLFR